MRRGVRIPAWYLLLVARPRDPEHMRESARAGAFCPASSRSVHGVAWDRAQALAVGFRPPLLLPAGDRHYGLPLQDWTIVQIRGGQPILIS